MPPLESFPQRRNVPGSLAMVGAGLLLATIPLAAQEEAPVPAARPDPSIRVTLESAYETWRRAMGEGDLRKWEEATAYSRQIETRNRIVSQGLPFPQALMDDPVEAPTLGGLTALGVFSTGETATSTYFGKANFGGDPSAVSDNMLVLHFLREDGRWRFDNLRIVKLGGDAELLLQLRNGDFSFLSGDEFQPAPRLPPVPQPVPAPELLAEAWIDATGYEVAISVNGHPMGRFSNIKTTELVMGGVRRGQNTVSLRIHRVDGARESSKVEIAIYAAKDAESPADRVFHFRPGTEVPLVLDEAFVVE